MTYTPSPITNEEVLRAGFAAELQQTPIRSWAELPASIGAPGLENFDGDTAPADLKASRMIVDGVIYLRGCEASFARSGTCGVASANTASPYTGRARPLN